MCLEWDSNPAPSVGRVGVLTTGLILATNWILSNNLNYKTKKLKNEKMRGSHEGRALIKMNLLRCS